MAAKLINRALVGFVLGMLAGVLATIIVSLTNDQGMLTLPGVLLRLTGSEAGALLAQMLFSGLYGIIPMAGTIIYEFDSWGMLKQAVVHYVSHTAAFLALGVLLGWFSPTPADLGIVTGSFAICHCIIWLIMYSRYRSEVKKLNELLTKAKAT